MATVICNGMLFGGFVENNGIELSETFDDISYTGKITLKLPESMKGIPIEQGFPIEINTKDGNVFNGVVWTAEENEKHHKTLNLTCKERTVYMEQSEDQFMFKAGTTATQRTMEICGKWGIPTGIMVDTGIGLAATPPMTGNIHEMLISFLKETAQKGGGLFKFRMGAALDLLPVGYYNWGMYEIENIRRSASLEGAVTQVKVVGAKDSGTKGSVSGTYSNATGQVGTMQRVVTEALATNDGTANTVAQSTFTLGKKSIEFDAVDQPFIRCGDAVTIPDGTFIVSSVTHKSGSPGHMHVQVMDFDTIKGEFFSNEK